MRAGGEPGRRERSRQEIAGMDGEAHAVSIARVKVGMRRQKSLRLGGRRFGKAIDIMVTVTLSMGDADQGAKREVLLHRQPRLAGQVLGGDEVLVAAGAPFG